VFSLFAGLDALPDERRTMRMVNIAAGHGSSVRTGWDRLFPVTSSQV
jgi:hypothetical protein